MSTAALRPALRLGPFSVARRTRPVLACLLLVLTGTILFGVMLAVGDLPLRLSEVVQVLLTDGGTRAHRMVVLEWRLPRAVTAVLVGAALALSGALMQSVTRNPLASPDILGVTVGASAGAVTAIAASRAGMLGAWLAGMGIPVAAAGGGLLSAGLIWVLAMRRGMDTYRFVLVGVVINALLVAWINFLMIRTDLNDASSAQFWLTGSLNAANWERAVPLAVVVGFALVGIPWVSFQLRAVQLGPDLATGLGVATGRFQALTIALSAVLAAAAVAAAGPLGFVAFFSPHLALRLCGTPTPPLVASLLTGAVLVMVADLVTSNLPVALPVGLFTSVVGGVFLVYLLVQTNRKATL